jgi:RNase P subunit RPR2
MPEENVRIMCPNLACRKVLAVPLSARGKTVRCKNCGTNIRIPSGDKDPSNKDKKNAA